MSPAPVKGSTPGAQEPQQTTAPNRSERRRLSASGARLILTSTAASCAALLLWLPRPVEPTELPALHLEPRAIGQVLQREGRAQMPQGPSADQVVALFRAQGEGETEGDTPEALQLRQRRVRESLTRLREEHGPDALAATRAAMTHPIDKILRGDTPEADDNALLGSFPRVLRRYNAAVEGRISAPMFVVRTLYKARWNAIFQLSPTDGFEDVEKQAYWGWLALHARDQSAACPECRADIALRREALRNFARAGGAAAEEAAAVFAFRNGRPDEASQIFARLHERTGALRFRNHALAALAAMQ